MFEVTKQKKPGIFLKAVSGYFFGHEIIQLYGQTATGKIFSEQYSGEKIEIAKEILKNLVPGQKVTVFQMGKGKYSSYTMNPDGFRK